jgi:MFS family permease
MEDRKATYWSLLRTPGVTPLFAVSLTSRMGGAMWMFSLTLLALTHFRSPQLAGAVGFASLAPAFPIGLMTGALLDRYGRRPLIAGDQLLALAVTASVYIALTSGVLSAPLLVALTALGAVTLPLTQIGTRSLKPLLVPRVWWDRANALDNAVTGAAYFMGTGLAGILFAWSVPAAAIAVIGVLWLLGAAGTLLMPEPRRGPATGRTAIDLLKSTLDGVRYAMSNPTLRTATMIFPFTNAAVGMSELTLTALLLQSTGSPATVGLVRSLEPVVAVGANLVAGRIRSEGRERTVLVLGLCGQAAVYGVVARWPYGPVIVAAILTATAMAGPASIAITSMLQRRIDPSMFGRATSATTIVGVMGSPLGTALAGATLGISPILALLTTAALVLAPALISLRLPSETQPPPTRMANDVEEGTAF